MDRHHRILTGIVEDNHTLSGRFSENSPELPRGRREAGGGGRLDLYFSVPLEASKLPTLCLVVLREGSLNRET